MIRYTRSLPSIVGIAVALVILPTFCRAQGLVSTLLIDPFTDYQHVDTGTSNPDASTIAGSMLGGERTLSLYTEVSGSPFGSSGQTLESYAFPVPAFESLQLASSSSFDSVSTVTFEGVGGAGLGGIDFTQNGGDRFWFDLTEHDHTADWLVTIEDSSANVATHTVSFGAYGSDPPDLTMIFTDFTNYSGTDFTSVDRVEFQVTSTQSALDFTLDFVSAAKVPEPSSALLFIGSGLLALSRRRR